MWSDWGGGGGGGRRSDNALQGVVRDGGEE